MAPGTKSISPNVVSMNRMNSRHSVKLSARSVEKWALQIIVLICALICLFVTAGIPVIATAQTRPTITDTQNLLGSQGSKVQSDLDDLKKDTGVTLNLLFVDSFGVKKLDKKTIGTWVNARLNFTKPDKNTLLLAVASQDGRMALAVSKGSDKWLSSQVDTTLSDAAAAPLARRNPDWTGSVTALVRSVRRIKTEHDQLPVKIGVTIGAIVVAIALIVGIILLIRWLRKIGFFAPRHGRHAAAH